MDRVKRIWYLSPMRAAKVQASLRIRAVSPEPPLLAHTSSESRGTFRQKARSLAPLNGWACAVKMCHDGMLEDTNSLDGAHMINMIVSRLMLIVYCCVANEKGRVKRIWYLSPMRAAKVQASLRIHSRLMTNGHFATMRDFSRRWCNKLKSHNLYSRKADLYSFIRGVI